MAGQRRDGVKQHAELKRRIKELIGVGDGYRTRDLLSHSQAFCH